MGKGRSRLRYSNRTKVLLCYLAAFGLPVLWMLAGLFWGYPYKLAGSAPHIAETLWGLFQGQARLAAAASAAQTSAGASPELWRQALQHREQQWLLFWTAVWAVVWLLTLLLQLGWRLRHQKPCFAARNTLRAIRGESGGRGGAVAAGRAVRAGPHRLGLCHLFLSFSAERSGGYRLFSAGRAAGAEREGSVLQASVGKGDAPWAIICWR